MSGTSSASGDTLNAPARALADLPLGYEYQPHIEPCEYQLSFPGKPTSVPRYFCVMSLRLRVKRILSPIAMGKSSCVCIDKSIADTLSDVKNLEL